MDQPQKVRRFRVNPIELVIFVAVSVICMHSIYNLFYNRYGFQPANVMEIASDTNSTTDGRSPASVAPTFANFETDCESAVEKEINAGKVRLTGTLCGLSSQAESSLIKTQVLNSANQFNATVFTDTSSAKYSTDYIPLSPGKNQIRVEFVYQNGKVIAQDISLNKVN
ncbi:MAG: hypothetical protein A3K03_11515 [Bdellovibrionales bacterium RIFOXYD1_FULL_44_7]|nr:MAG: hypothetical protein A3K03_11515 [Bdellovibrionales bacterium RIFOXYD1_FULL_44_7]